MKITTRLTITHDAQGASHGLWRLHCTNRPEVTLSYHRGREAAQLAQLRLEALPESLIELICNKASKLGLEPRLRLAHEVGQVLETWPAADLEHELRLLAFNHCATLVDTAEAALALLDQRRHA